MSVTLENKSTNQLLAGKPDWETEDECIERMVNYAHVESVLNTELTEADKKLAAVARLDITKTPSSIMMAELRLDHERKYGGGQIISMNHKLRNHELNIRFESVFRASHNKEGDSDLYTHQDLPNSIMRQVDDEGLFSVEETMTPHNRLRLAAYNDLANQMFMLPGHLGRNPSNKNTLDQIKVGQHLEEEMLNLGLMKNNILSVDVDGKPAIFAGFSLEGLGNERIVKARFITHVPEEDRTIAINHGGYRTIGKTLDPNGQIIRPYDTDIQDHFMVISVNLDRYVKAADTNFHRSLKGLRYGARMASLNL